MDTASKDRVATLGQIRLFPIKSLDAVTVDEVAIGCFSLAGDRAYAIVDDTGRVINGKRTGRVNQLRAEYGAGTVTLGEREAWEPHTFELRQNNDALDAYLSDFFAMPAHLVHDDEGRLLDIPRESSVTVIAAETLRSLSAAMGFPDLRERFRTNLELTDAPAFFEEQLVGPDEAVGFSIGDVRCFGMSIRERCNVPPRDPGTGEIDRRFAKALITARDASVPAWSHVRELGSLYHLAINVFVPRSEQGKRIRVGDRIRV